MTILEKAAVKNSVTNSLKNSLKSSCKNAFIIAFSLIGCAALADTHSDVVAKSAINQYVIIKSLSGSSATGETLTPSQLCYLTGQANLGLVLLQGKSDQEISNLVELVEAKSVSALRAEIKNDRALCN